MEVFKKPTFPELVKILVKSSINHMGGRGSIVLNLKADYKIQWHNFLLLFWYIPSSLQIHSMGSVISAASVLKLLLIEVTRTRWGRETRNYTVLDNQAPIQYADPLKLRPVPSNTKNICSRNGNRHMELKQNRGINRYVWWSHFCHASKTIKTTNDL